MPAPGHRFVLSIPTPHTHLVHVELTLDADAVAAAATGGGLDVVVPAWSPGSYLIRDYARMVRDLTATAGDATLAVTKRDKHTWRIAVPGPGPVTVRYAVYAHELTVRTSHVDATHAFVHAPATFVHVPALRDRPVALEVRPPDGRGWRLACGLPRDGVPAGAPDPFGPVAPTYRLRAASIDELYDSPLHLGHDEVRRFTAGGKPFELAVWGDRLAGGAFSLDTLVTDLTAIVDDHVARLGVAPYDHYTFVLMLSHDAYGGLEHRASSANLHNPRALAVRKDYEGLLELLSHEFFHAWNGKRIAPPQLLDFDYGREAHTRCLWVMEGLTSHYDRWALRTSGRIGAKTFLDKLLDDWTRLVAIPGRRRHSLEASSFDAWIKLYKPDESNLNTTVSYYLKGGLVATTLDLEIRRRTEGARSLDDVLRLLWTEHGARGVGHPEDVQPLFERATGLSLDDVFDRQIRGTDDPPLAAELRHVGLELRAAADPATTADGATPVWLGATVSGGGRVTGVLDDAPAAAAGLSPGDELIAVDGLRVGGDGDVRAMLAARRPGDTVRLALFRRHRLLDLAVTLAEAPPTKWEIAAAADVPAEVAARYQAWLGEPYPGATVLATVSTTSRSV
jgi:predicted metalloprotease with PDZ domain